MTKKINAIASLKNLDPETRAAIEWVETVLLQHRHKAPERRDEAGTLIGLHGMPYPFSLFQARVLRVLADCAPEGIISHAPILWNAVHWGRELPGGSAWMSVPWRIDLALGNGSAESCSLGKLLLCCEAQGVLLSIQPFNKKAMTLFFNNNEGEKGRRRLVTLAEMRHQMEEVL